MVAAFRALVAEPRKDPGCLAKEQLLAALDALEHPDADLFAEAARLVQHEGAKGHARDTGGRVRARGVLGVARLGHPDALPVFGACLADHDANVRLSAARALAHRGERSGAGLLLLKLGVGDEVREVMLECLVGLFSLAPDLAAPRAREMLRGAPSARELACQALGAARTPIAVELLAAELACATLATDREMLIEGLGLSPCREARALLLDLVNGDRMSDARAALRALSIHRYDTRLIEQVRAKTTESRELSALVQELFGPR
ncbi:MAG: hypothetical protein HYV09_38125 [Deltaproteobacteria bacterium]|nr:hypothetical protein [Deltaproteobacteria bacterium]